MHSIRPLWIIWLYLKKAFLCVWKSPVSGWFLSLHAGCEHFHRHGFNRGTSKRMDLQVERRPVYQSETKKLLYLNIIVINLFSRLFSFFCIWCLKSCIICITCVYSLSRHKSLHEPSHHHHHHTYPPLHVLHHHLFDLTNRRKKIIIIIIITIIDDVVTSRYTSWQSMLLNFIIKSIHPLSPHHHNHQQVKHHHHYHHHPLLSGLIVKLYCPHVNATNY